MLKPGRILNLDIVAHVCYLQFEKEDIMNKTSTVRARIEPDLKEEVEGLFRKLGLSVTEAIKIFYKQVQLQHGLPFPVVVPNKSTAETFKKTDAGEEIVVCVNAKEMFDKLKI